MILIVMRVDKTYVILYAWRMDQKYMIVIVRREAKLT